MIRRSRTTSTASRPSAIRPRPMPSALGPCSRTQANRRWRRRCSGSLLAPPVSVSASKAARLSPRPSARARPARRGGYGRSQDHGSKSQLLQMPVANGGVNSVSARGEIEMAEREGFEPSIRLPVYTRSRRAPSTTRPPLRVRMRACGSLADRGASGWGALYSPSGGERKAFRRQFTDAVVLIARKAVPGDRWDGCGWPAHARQRQLCAVSGRPAVPAGGVVPRQPC